MSGTLFLVSVPIGNDDDITFRAVRILREADIIVFEEKKSGNRFLANIGLSRKQYENLNEHNEKEMSGIILQYLMDGKNIALISDAGTPVFSDPGKLLVQKIIENNIKIVPVPGVSSIVPALVLCGFFIDEFVVCGFLSPKSDQRKAELLRLRDESRVMVLMDTPYRLAGLVKDISSVFGNDRQIAIGFNLTMPDEQVLRGRPGELYQMIDKLQMKGEFVIVIESKRNIHTEK